MEAILKRSLLLPYLDSFHPDQEMVKELKDHYKRGGLPDKIVKEKTAETLISIIEPIREKENIFLPIQMLSTMSLRKGL